MHRLGVLAHECHYNRRQSLILEIVCQRAHGARARGSDWCENECVDAVAEHRLTERSRIAFEPVGIGGAHE